MRLNSAFHCYDLYDECVAFLKGFFSPSFFVQLCGVRGDGNAAAKALFWQARKGLSFVLTFETERDRNAAIMLARKYASDGYVSLFKL